MDPDEIGNELRLIVGELVRQTRAGDTLAPRLASALGHLDREGALTTAELATRRQVRHQSMAATVKELTEAGYVTRDADPTDGRRILISITPEGRARLQTERGRRAGRLGQRIAEQLSIEERARLAQALPLLRRLADEDSASR